MRKSLLVILLLIVTQPIWAQKKFEKDIKEALYIHDTASTLSSELVAREAFQKLTNKYPNEWLGFYWLAYLNTQIARLDGIVDDFPKDLDSKQLIRESLDLHKKSYKLKKNKTDAEESDFLALEGFIYGWFSYRLAENEEQKSQYDVKKISKYKKAISLNPKNPLMYVLAATPLARSEDYNDILASLALFDAAESTFNQAENRGMTTYWNKDFIGYWRSQAEKNLERALSQ
ncbi:MAG: hypothetical protein ABJF04_06000 [Reichenbachiella sp.]|uniref:hypothetical protein n=1 Tax=Reichenbachiella sp. TaxID=2184521 RepID=UPI00326668DD